jgi:hypothetical protein
MHVIGFRGLMENRTIRSGDSALSGILTAGGTNLGDYVAHHKKDSYG